MSNKREFDLLFEKSALEQKQLAELLGVKPMTVNRWLTDRVDHVDPPFYALQFIRMYLMLPAAARAHLPIKRIEKSGGKEAV